ncbi:hypothetical protein DLP3_066 [Stenotrophomonas phage vB_SmaS_DLP_3]|nr:hypothetical protein DLP3_066 [Stenotrophomonas phage vB_SmaS_DLP_3]
MDKNVQAALSAKIDVRGEEYTVEQAMRLMGTQTFFTYEELIKAILKSQTPEPDVDRAAIEKLSAEWLAKAENLATAPLQARALWACAKELRDVLSEQKPKGFIVTGLTDSQLVSKMQEIGHAESIRDILVSRIGVPAHTVLIDEMTYARWKERYDVETLAVNGEAYWYWQGDKQDYPESLTCPVIMSAEKLREMLGNANRYTAWRDSMIAHLLEEQLIIQQALPQEVGESRPPTAQEWDVAIDALRKFRDSKDEKSEGQMRAEISRQTASPESNATAEALIAVAQKCIWPDCGHDTNRIGYGADGCNGVGCPK